MKAPVPGGELEFAVLAALWDIGPASARDVHERVGSPKGLVYTTTAKVLDRLHDKGLVSRQKNGRAFVFEARVSRLAILRLRARGAVARLLGDAPRPAMAALVDAVHAVDPKLLAHLEALVIARRRGRRGS